MTLDPALLEILACPIDKGPLLYVEDESFLYNPRERRRYDIRDGIPVMLVDESTVVDDAEHARITGLTTGVTTGRPTGRSDDAG